jgi:hypothetical protein
MSERYALDKPASRSDRIARFALVAWAVINIAVVGLLVVNHLSFPANLDLMEGTVLQHVRQAVAGLPIYPPPTPDYVPLAYNPLFYVISVPFTWLLGLNLTTLRLVSVLAMIGSAVVIYRVVYEKTGSRWWALIALGLFSAAYRAMETYLDNAHSDAWLIFTALLGTYIVDKNRSRAWNVSGLLILLSSFWFKQHGALFAIGGVLFLTLRLGLRRSIGYWLIAAVLGPVLYLFAGTALFGAYFQVFTWRVPSQWSEVNLSTFTRYLRFIARYYSVLAAAGGVAWLVAAVRDWRKLSAWHIQFVLALLSGLMGSLDPGSANNVYIPMGTWLIVMGVWGLQQLAQQFRQMRRFRLDLIGVATSFALLLYNPLPLIVSPQAQTAYADLISLLNSLPGPVYAPSIGQLQSGYVLSPTAHWVALEDMIRGLGRDTRDHPNTLALLQPAIEPSGPAYILANTPLETYPWIAFLNDYYVLDTDFGERFEALRVLPKRFDHLWPRYLYRYSPEKAALHEPSK